MAIAVTLYYTGQDGSALAFAREMEASGLVSRIRAQTFLQSR